MYVHVIEAWTALAVFIVGCKAICAVPRRWADRKYEEGQRFKRQVVTDYVETGRDATTVGSFDRRTVKAALKQRRARINEKAEAAKDFKAVCECPWCGYVAVHWLSSGGKRICRNEECNYEWKQN